MTSRYSMLDLASLTASRTAVPDASPWRTGPRGRRTSRRARPALAVALTLVALTGGAAGGAAAQASAPVGTEIGARIGTYLERLSLYGFSGAVLVSKDDHVVLERGFGVADDQTGERVHADTPFLIGSLSKQFTAAAILRLEAQGRLTTADTVGRFYPEASPPLRGTTLHALLTHTAGLPYLSERFSEVMPRTAVMEEVLGLPVDPARAGSYFYSSPGYTLLAGVIERASGVSYEDYLRAELFEPAGMTRTGFSGEGRWEADARIRSYSGAVDEGPLHAFPAFPKAVGAGSVVSTVGDLNRWVEALGAGRVLPDSLRSRLFTPHVTVQGPVGHGYGWNIATTVRGTPIIVHGGDLGGYNSELRMYPDEGLVLVLLSNRRPGPQGWRQAIMNNLSLLIAGAEYAAPPAVTRSDEADLAAYAGRYALDAGGRIDVVVANGVLVLGADSPAGAALIAGMDAPLQALATSLDRKAEPLAHAIAGDGLDALRPLVHASLPFDGLAEGIRSAVRSGTGSIGPLRDVRVLATAATTPVTASTAIRLVHERGEQIVHARWLSGLITGLDLGAPVPLPTWYANEDADLFAAFDPFTGRVVRARFERDGGGAVTALTIEGVRAGRVGPP